MIELVNVRKKFGSRMAVDELSFTVARGEIFGLLGHNGAGKSTAIGMMLGQVWPTGGEVKICGHDVAVHRSAALKQVGAIFETPVFYDYLSGWRNLEILSTYTAPTPPGRIREVVEWVGLTGRERCKVRTYSHGMRARLALAQALLPRPELLILDEPSDGLDPEGIHEMRQTILRLQRELGLTILLSSHLLNEVEQLCTRIAILQQGKKVFEGSVVEVKSGRGRVALKTPDFAAAARLLCERGLITATAEDRFITLAAGHSTGEVTQALVASGLAVDGIWQHEQTVEDFYLGLVNRQREEATQ
ncbi:MAG TPA: ABC transporter ATP-binding protein [Candidatus Acidoferrales bacterium]|nr:ABC transporter ATP-binding protein [Candidatus Acidoferrales bacterium]